MTIGRDFQSLANISEIQKPSIDSQACQKYRKPLKPFGIIAEV